uniref:Uncharacterized protein n=1 Tax=Onchocerca volvulus TaxID=6282 RepID=A0A8R1XQ87_ONCVO
MVEHVKKVGRIERQSMDDKCLGIYYAIASQKVQIGKKKTIVYCLVA